jgi:nucleoid DNA-binding protein
VWKSSILLFLVGLHADAKHGINTPVFFWLELEVVMAKKATRLDKAMGKGDILTALAASTELPKKDVGRVLDALAELIERHIAQRSVGMFTLPGLLKVKVVQTPARPARQGVPNPFRPGETMDVAAKPARRKVKVLPLSKLKAMIG